MDDYYELLNFSLKPFGYIGISPQKELKKIIMLIVFLCLFILVILNCLQIYHAALDLKILCGIFSSSFVITQAFAKLGTLIFKKQEIKYLLDTVSNFWIASGDENEKFQIKIKTLLNYGKIFIKLFTLSAFCSISSFIFKAIFSGILPIICYIPKSVPFWSFAIFDCASVLYIGVLVLIFDNFVGCIIYLLFIQFKILNKKFSSIDFSRVDESEENRKLCDEEMKACVNHHIVLTSFLTTLNQVISITLLVQFLITFSSCCFELLLLSKYSRSLGELYNSVSYLIALYMELMLIYGMPSQLVADEASQIGISIYNSNWTECKNTVIRKHLIIIMERIQKEQYVTAGGIFIMGFEVCSKIIKASYTAYAFLNTL